MSWVSSMAGYCRCTHYCCIWSSMFEKAALSVSAFLTSSALMYGYSPYSRNSDTDAHERT